MQIKTRTLFPRLINKIFLNDGTQSVSSVITNSILKWNFNFIWNNIQNFWNVIWQYIIKRHTKSCNFKLSFNFKFQF